MIEMNGFRTFLPRKSDNCQLENSITTGVDSFTLSKNVSGLTVIFPPKKQLNPA